MHVATKNVKIGDTKHDVIETGFNQSRRVVEWRENGECT